MSSKNFTLYKDDLPKDLIFSDVIAIDTETMGLDFKRDRLCLVQISNGDNHAHLVQIEDGKEYPNLYKLLKNNKKQVEKNKKKVKNNKKSKKKKKK